MGGVPVLLEGRFTDFTGDFVVVPDQRRLAAVLRGPMPFRVGGQYDELGRQFTRRRRFRFITREPTAKSGLRRTKTLTDREIDKGDGDCLRWTSWSLRADGGLYVTMRAATAAFDWAESAGWRGDNL